VGVGKVGPRFNRSPSRQGCVSENFKGLGTKNITPLEILLLDS